MPTPPTVTHDQPPLLTLDDRGTTPAYNSGHAGLTLSLETTRDAELVGRALELRLGDLEGLAKKNTTEGYGSAARVQLGDAAVLRSRILPQLATQLRLRNELDAQPVLAQLRASWRRRIELALSITVERAEERGAGTVTERELRMDAADALAGELVAPLEAFAHTLYELAYHAGLSERRSGFETLAREAAQHFGL